MILIDCEKMKTIGWVMVMAVLTAGGAGVGPAAAGAKPKTLGDFLPPTLGDGKREPTVSNPAPNAHAAYLLPERRFVNVNLMWVRDGELAGEKAAFRVSRVGETRENTAARLRHQGFEVDGVFVQRTQYLPRPDGSDGGKSEARALLADRIVVIVSIERARNPDEPLGYLRKLDLRGLAALERLKKLKGPPPVTDGDLLNTKRAR